MKKLLLFTACIYIVFALNAQIQQLQNFKSENYKQANGQVKSPKAYGDIYWQEDFNAEKWSYTVVQDSLGYKLDTNVILPEGWLIDDSLNLNYYWHWSDLGPRGAYSTGSDGDCHTPDNDRIDFMQDYYAGAASLDNGFMLFEADYFNTTDECTISEDYQRHNSYFQFGPIDFSEAPGVMLNLKIFYWICCYSTDNIVVEFCDDYNPITEEANWGDKYNLRIKSDNGYFVLPEERDMYLNVSKDVVGKSNVYFRIRVDRPSHYFFVIDDIKFYEAHAHDMVLEDAWADYLFDAELPEYEFVDEAKYNFYGGYTQIPFELVSEFVQFRAAVKNNGHAEAINAKMNVNIYKDEELLYSEATSPVNIDGYTLDTFRLSTGFIPGDKGNYQVSLTVSEDDEDGVPGDTGWEYNFVVSDTVYSRVNHGNEENFKGQGPRDWAAGGYEGDAIVQYYDINRDVCIKGLQIYFPDYLGMDDELAAIEAGDYKMIGKVYKDVGSDIVDMGIATDEYILTTDDLGTWVTLFFNKEGNLYLPASDSTFYYVGIETYTGQNNQELRFEVGADPSIKQPYYDGGLCYLTGEQLWITTGHNYAIDLIIDKGVSIKDAKYKATNIEISPNPFTDKLVIEGIEGVKLVKITNLMGQTIMTIPAEKASIISTANLSKGVYLITFINDENHLGTRRIVKQ